MGGISAGSGSFWEASGRVLTRLAVPGLPWGVDGRDDGRRAGEVAKGFGRRGGGRVYGFRSDQIRDDPQRSGGCRARGA